MKLLITGGAGFIGHHLISLLLEVGAQDIHVIDIRKSDKVYDGKVRFWQGDIVETIRRNPEILAGVDIVFHLSWSSIPKSATQNPLADLNTNVASTLRLLDLCTSFQIKRFVFISTGGAIYGIPKHLPVSEDHPTDPISAYGITKLAVEKYLALFHRLYGLEYAIIRPSVPYGEFQNPFGNQGVIAVFLGKIIRNEPIEIWGNPDRIIRDFFHVSDLARACWLAAISDEPTGLYNIGGAIGISLTQLIDTIQFLVDSTHRIETKIMPARQFDVPALVLDISRARGHLNWSPEIEFITGLNQMWHWVQNYTKHVD